MKTELIIKKWKSMLFAAMLITSGIFFSSCRKDLPPTQQSCSVYGIFTQVPRGVGIYGDYWIRLDNGSYLEPCETSILTLRDIQPREGQRIKFGYVKTSPGNWCETAITCMMTTPPAERIKITCLQQLPAGSTCTHNGVIVYNDKLMRPCNPKVIRMDDGTMLEPMNQDMISNYVDGQQINFSYNVLMTFAVTCTGYAAVQLTCVN